MWIRAVPEIILGGGEWTASYYTSTSGEKKLRRWMYNNVKFVLRDEDIQVNIIRHLVFRFILGWAFVPFRMSWGWRSQ